ncbi:hypothetical protein OJF2_03480 [Aquisphaera giovannonii]|uniref:DUF3775 domain-containing protein n=1 Tax=Aquisphaera giovannonii TaxID=406548 RepID=A0A5B9VVK4_9BACT|nr:DUF3775 domain-containing protein [Aquisphaera giovannonii]QEH31881.1 hypothetical protein OJF2_03480 [Aquisphaera giovannonii]
MTLSEVVGEIIRLGDASRAYWDRELPKDHPHYPLILDGEKQTPPPPEDAQILSILESLPEAQIYAVALLMYLGRGDFAADRIPSAIPRVKKMLPTKDLAIDQIMSQTALAEYLADAVAEARRRRIDLDDLASCDAVAVN